ncbi:hypothetical protein [Nonomuraea dietziae]|uniref:hypothetical protein n=1 Tax=Nonomuraea dietziae TaxID=65515 RepID=UPI0031D03B19
MAVAQQRPRPGRLRRCSPTSAEVQKGRHGGVTPAYIVQCARQQVRRHQPGAPRSRWKTFAEIYQASGPLRPVAAQLGRSGAVRPRRETSTPWSRDCSLDLKAGGAAEARLPSSPEILAEQASPRHGLSLS